MNKFENHIQVETLLEMEKVIGREIKVARLGDKIVEFYFETSHIECDIIAIYLKDINEYIVIDNKWLGDSPKHAIDYRKLDIRFERRPDFLNGHKQIRGEGDCRRMDSAELQFFSNWETVTSIELFKYIYSYEDESVDFDMSIVFHCSSKMFIVTAGQSIQDSIVISNFKKVYNKLKKQCELSRYWPSKSILKK